MINNLKQQREDRIKLMEQQQKQLSEMEKTITK